MLSILYDQDYVTECYEKELYDDAMQKGMKQGIQQGTINLINDLVKEGILTRKDANKRIAKIK